MDRSQAAHTGYMASLIDAEAILRESRRLSHLLSTAPISPDSVCYRRLARRLAHLERLRFRMETGWRMDRTGSQEAGATPEEASLSPDEFQPLP
ncbi:MAG TPA: hypothetical protein VF234_03320 [Limnochordia bacterium]